jgi:Baseplate J-like protein
MMHLGAICRDEQRRADILVHPTLNGIDFVEYEHRPAEPHPHVLLIHFLKPLPNPNSGPDGAYGLTTHLDQIIIDGGKRIVGIEATEVHTVGDHLEIDVNQAGDSSDYELFLGYERQPDGSLLHVIDTLDAFFSVIVINFKAGCPVDFDCRPVEICPPQPVKEPLIDYLARDYASFRQLLLDWIPRLNPDWLERNPADLGMAIVELLAYEGDHLSYFQDAVANERFLDTVRQRVSAKRHARLIDYRMHDGRNAWTYVHFNVESTGFIDQGTKVLSRITAPLGHASTPPGVVVAEDDVSDETFESHPALSRARVFETSFPSNVHDDNNKIFIHTWGNLECCLPRGTTSVHLYSVTQQGNATVPPLNVGDFVLFEEVKGPITGAQADADPAHRQVVQLEEVQITEDAAYNDQPQNDQLQPWQSGDTPLPLLKVSWHTRDALLFPLCLSTRPPGKDPVLNISIARGNMILADHGRTLSETIPQPQPVPADEPFRLRLRLAPLTMQCQPEDATYDPATGLLKTPRTQLRCPVSKVTPAVTLLVNFVTGTELWQLVPDLLDSPPFAQHFVVDLDHDGRAELRFGDGEYGREPAGALSFTAVYRVGNGRAGNVGAEALAHVVQPAVAPNWPSIVAVRNPLAARDGVDTETIEQVRQHAPAAFRAEQFRAVTEFDYMAAARKMPDVAEAVATFRWTGSWHTVFIGIDPKNPEDVITEPGGSTHLAPLFEQHVRNFLTRYRLAGYDMEILSGRYVPLAIDLMICVASGYFQGDVIEAVRQALSNRIKSDGTYGFFHPDHFTFGQAVYISRLYAAVEAVQGVDSLVVTRFQRYGEMENAELATGVIAMGPWEIARLDNDPNFMENGVLRISADGGK